MCTPSIHVYFHVGQTSSPYQRCSSQPARSSRCPPSLICSRVKRTVKASLPEHEGRPQGSPLPRRPSLGCEHTQRWRNAVAKLSIRHSQPSCSCSHMISLSKKKEKQKQLPIEHYNFKNHLLIVANRREEEIKVLAFRLQSCIQGYKEPSHVCVLSPC